jgi:hypothetical protein
MILLITASQVARTTDVSHQCDPLASWLLSILIELFIATHNYKYVF